LYKKDRPFLFLCNWLTALLGLSLPQSFSANFLFLILQFRNLYRNMKVNFVLPIILGGVVLLLIYTNSRCSATFNRSPSSSYRNYYYRYPAYRRTFTFPFGFSRPGQTRYAQRRQGVPPQRRVTRPPRETSSEFREKIRRQGYAAILG